MDYQLVIVRGRSGAQALQLADGVTTVGRHDECQLRIKSSQVSRKHCELFEKKGLLLVKDLGSSNGTFVNGEKVDGQRVLEPGDELTIGQIKLRVEKKTGAAAPQAAVADSGAKPNDTAITAAPTEPAPTNVTPAAIDDEFEIDFDEPSAPTTAIAGDAAAEFDDLLDSPLPAPAASPPPTKPAPADPAPVPEPEKGVADDAIADFLLDIKFDDDDR